MKEITLTLEEIARETGSLLKGDPGHVIKNVADLETANSSDASFLANPKYEKAMHTSKAGVIFIDSKTPLIDGKNYLISESPSRSFQTLIEIFYGKEPNLTGFKGIHPTAVIHETAKLDPSVQVGPYAVIDAEVIIGKGTFIGSGCYIGPQTLIGEDCIIHPHVTIREQNQIGNRVVLQPGAVIGSCGFGFTTDKFGNHTKLNQVGNVTIEDDVEIGSNTTIDRSRFKTTKIGRGTKIDNLVQIAHGVLLGEHNLIIAQAGIAGSAVTGKYVVIAGQSAINGHIKICDQVMIAAKSGVSKSITQPGKYGGIPVLPLDEYNRNTVYLRNIERFVKELKALKSNL